MLSIMHQNYYAQLCELYDEEMENIEIAAVGTELGGKFNHTSELKLMKFKEDMNRPDSDKQKEEIKNKHKRMVINGVCELLDKKDLLKGAKIITLTWACKKPWYIPWSTKC